MHRRTARSVLSTALFVIIATTVYADGMFVWRNRDVDIREPQQKAFIVHEDGFQDLVLSVKFEGAADDFGWLVPLPSRPDMEPAAGPVFTTLSQTMQEPFVGMSQTFAGLTATAGMDGISPLRATHHDVGIYDVTLLEGGDGNALEGWLGDHGYNLPDGAAVVLDEYAAKGWTLAAIKIDPDQIDGTTGDDLKNGEIDPIHFRFATAEAIFPLRISSLNGHPSEILLYVLADRPLRPAVDDRISWTVTLKPWQRAVMHISDSYWADPGYDPTVHHLPKPPPSFMRDLYGRFFDRTDELWLTKSRATVSPEAMVDLTFTDQDVAAALAADELQTRVEAASYAGLAGDAAAVPLLIEFLSGHEIPRNECDPFLREHRESLRPGQDLRSSLWALGMLGDGRAVPEVRRWASSGRPLYQVDALDALRRLDPTAAAEVSLDIVERGNRVSKRDYCERGLHALARSTIVEYGGPELLARLADLVERDLDPNFFEKMVQRVDQADPELGPDAVAMAAACGDTVAQAILKQWLTESAASWCYDLADGDSTGSKGLGNDYPSVLFPLSSVATMGGFSDFRPKNKAVFRTLRDRPDVRDMILRDVAAIDTLSVMSRAILLGEVTDPTDSDIAALKHLWSAAREHPRRIYVEFRGEKRGRTCPLWSVFDLDAFAVAYALARHGEEDVLMSLWRRVPWSEPELRGEIVAALVAYGDYNDRSPALLAAAAEYMRRVWNPRIRELDRQGCYTADGFRPNGWPYPRAFDPPHRERALERLYGPRQRVAAVKLVEDVTLDPAVQLYWLQRSWVWLRRSDPERLDSLLHQVSARLRDPELMTACDRVADRIVELDARAASAQRAAGQDDKSGANSR